MSNKYTPDSDYVRTVFGLSANTPSCSINPETLWEERTKQFDRWLETVRAEAKAEALIEYADAIQHVDDVIQRQADSDDRWTDFQDAEREFTRNDGGVARDYYTAATHYARYRANQYKENQS